MEIKNTEQNQEFPFVVRNNRKHLRITLVVGLVVLGVLCVYWFRMMW